MGKKIKAHVCFTVKNSQKSRHQSALMIGKAILFINSSTSILFIGLFSQLVIAEVRSWKFLFWTCLEDFCLKIIISTSYIKRKTKRKTLRVRDSCKQKTPGWHKVQRIQLLNELFNYLGSSISSISSCLQWKYYVANTVQN